MSANDKGFDEIFAKFQNNLPNSEQRAGRKQVLASQENLLTHPHLFVKGICEHIQDISEERVSEIVLNAAAPQNSRGRTKSIEMRELLAEEPELITEEIKKFTERYKNLIMKIMKKDNAVKMVLRPEMGYLGDALLLKPWEFVRTIAEMADMDEDKVSEVALQTVAPADERGITKRITIEGLSEADLQLLAESISTISSELKKRQFYFDYALHVNDDLKVDRIDIVNIRAEPEIFTVAQGNFVITESATQTEGLDTCTAVGIRFANGSNFLAHIDAQTNTQYMKNAINELIAGGTEIVDYRVWVGLGMIGGVSADLSKAKAQEILTLLASGEKPNYSVVSFADNVGIRKDGTFYQRKN